MKAFFLQWYPYIFNAVFQQIRARYVDTLLGPLWVVLLPVVLILIYTTIFSKVLHARLAIDDHPLAYSIFLCAGLIPWLYFSDLLNRLTNVYTSNAHLLKKVPIPTSALVLIAVLISLFDFLIFFSIYVVFLIIIDYLPPLYLWVYAFFLTILLTIFTITVGVFLAVLQVFFRDTGHFVGIALQLGFWLTPIVYPLQVVPEWARQIIQFNPLVGVIKGYQDLFLAHQALNISQLVPVTSLALLGGGLAWYILKRRGKELVDVL